MADLFEDETRSSLEVPCTYSVRKTSFDQHLREVKPRSSTRSEPSVPDALRSRNGFYLEYRRSESWYCSLSLQKVSTRLQFAICGFVP